MCRWPESDRTICRVEGSTAGISAFDLICGPVSDTSICACSGGVAGVGVSPCTKCASCDPGNVLSYDYCVPGAEVECTSPAYITEIALRSNGWIDSVDSVTCSDGTVLPVNVGNTTTGSPQIVAMSGDGSSTSPGFCAVSYGHDFGDSYSYYHTTQLSFTECTTATEVGPYGTDVSAAYAHTTCPVGQTAYGLKVVTLGSTSVTDIYIFCGASTDSQACACFGGVAAVGDPPCNKCTSCEAGYALDFSSWCVADVATTVAPNTL